MPPSTGPGRRSSPCARRWCDTALLSPWEIAPALAAWQAAAEAWNEAVADAAVDVRGFMEEHAEPWLESARGQAYDAWAEALENAAIETEPSRVPPAQPHFRLGEWADRGHRRECRRDPARVRPNCQNSTPNHPPGHTWPT